MFVFKRGKKTRWAHVCLPHGTVWAVITHTHLNGKHNELIVIQCALNSFFFSSFLSLHFAPNVFQWLLCHPILWTIITVLFWLVFYCVLRFVTFRVLFRIRCRIVCMLRPRPPLPWKTRKVSSWCWCWRRYLVNSVCSNLIRDCWLREFIWELAIDHLLSSFYLTSACLGRMAFNTDHHVRNLK